MLQRFRTVSTSSSSTLLFSWYDIGSAVYPVKFPARMLHDTLPTERYVANDPEAPSQTGLGTSVGIPQASCNAPTAPDSAEKSKRILP